MGSFALKIQPTPIKWEISAVNCCLAARHGFEYTQKFGFLQSPSHCVAHPQQALTHKTIDSLMNLVCTFSDASLSWPIISFLPTCFIMMCFKFSNFGDPEILPGTSLVLHSATISPWECLRSCHLPHSWLHVWTRILCSDSPFSV